MKILAKAVLIAATAVLAACGTAQKVSDLDPNTGHLPTEHKARVVLSKPLNLDAHRALLLVPSSDFVKGQIEKIGYFGELMTVSDLQGRIVKANLTDKVPAIQDKIGVANAAKHYKPFLWFRYEGKGQGREQQARYVLTDAATMEDYFVAETDLDFVWAGVNDQRNWYPMFNSFIDYIKANSRTYGR